MTKILKKAESQRNKRQKKKSSLPHSEKDIFI